MVLLADYIGIDAAGKINALGQGFTITAVQATGATAPQYIAALIDLPASSAGDQMPVTIELRDETTGMIAELPGEGGQIAPMRIQQLAAVQRAQLPGVHLPQDLPCRVQLMLAFPMGLPLTPGHRYAWKLEVDGTRLKGWSAHFYVAAPPPPPVFGGPAGPADIGNIVLPTEVEDEPDTDGQP